MPQKMKLPPGAVLVDSQPQPMRLPPGATLVPQVQAPQSDEPQVDPMIGADISGNVAESAGHAVTSTLKDIGAGALKGLGQNAATVSGWLNKLPYVGETLAPKQGVAAFKQITTPDNFPQKLGAGIEQGAELMAPSGAIGKGVKAASAFGTGARIAARMGLDALATGGNAAMHDQSPVAGAALGAAGGAVGEGLTALAPKLAESSLGIRAADRARGRTPGAAILRETTGDRPGTVMQQAKDVLSRLEQEMQSAESAADKSGRLVSLQPARDVVERAIGEAQQRNSQSALRLLNKVKDQLTKEFDSLGKPALERPTSTAMESSPILNARGEPFVHPIDVPGKAVPKQLPVMVPPSKLRAIKQGIGEEVKSWMVENPKLAEQTKAQAYGALNSEFHPAVPGSAGLDQRMSNLIPVAKRAEAVSNNAGVTQRVAHRVAAHTGALAASVGGGYEGYRQGGVPGAMAGAALGLAVPELVASPTAQMFAARRLASPGLNRIYLPMLRGLGLQGLPNADEVTVHPPDDY